jgi:hypothetical protein
MQDHAAIAIGKKCIHLIRGRSGLIDRAGEACRRTDRDAAAPGIGRLARRGRVARIRIGQAIAFRNVHEHEGIERDGEAARLQIEDRGSDTGIGRCAAIGRTIVAPGDDISIAPGGARHTPTFRRGAANRLLDTRLHDARSGAQVVAEPTDH